MPMIEDNEPCPECKSTNTTVSIHGAIRQWWCQNCGKPFMPEWAKRRAKAGASNEEGL